ncbi:MAG: hypothetical protein NVSMB6_09380 [Burkholderiaceae bacterium]
MTFLFIQRRALMHIVFIHGHGATSDSFDFLRAGLASHPATLLDYDSELGFYNNLEAMQAQLEGLGEIFFVAHSLGGIYALHLANALGEKVVGGLTISTPYAGSQAAQLVKYLMPFNQMLRDIQPGSAPIEDANAWRIQHPWTNIVTTDGHSSFMLAANDGVVTQESMRHRRDIHLVDVHSNHFEVLVNPETLSVVSNCLNELVQRKHSTLRNAG